MGNLQMQAKQKKSPEGALVSMVNLVGVLDESTVVKFEETMMTLLGRGLKNVILNCKELEYINSSGMGLLVNMADRFNEKGGGVKLLSVPAKMAALFEMLGLHDLFQSYGMEEEAVTSFAPVSNPTSRPVPPPLQNASTRKTASYSQEYEPMLLPDEMEESKALDGPSLPYRSGEKAQGSLSTQPEHDNHSGASPANAPGENSRGHDPIQKGIIQLLQSRFGDVPKEIQTKIYETGSKKTLETLLNNSALTATLVEFAQEMFRTISDHRNGEKRTISIEIKIHY